MKFIKTTLCLLALGLFMVSCGDDDSNPVLTITSPENGTVYAPGDMFEIIGTVTDDLEVVDISVSSSILEDDSFPNQTADPTTYDFTLNVPVSDQATAGDYDITLTAKDSGGNTDAKTLTITVQ